ncbi:hypothetical protein [Nocardioides yefusunii]|uniref:Uncharacterized protein n=1 Tax=Nocardioides yefusunii TaxID=2500546 RepID=A0ABW1QZ04_9ACTN|nr:hypothetical protein [Nocardioides yefusunii]
MTSLPEDTWVSAGWTPAAGRRPAPGTVVAAVVVTWVSAVLCAAMAAIVGGFLLSSPQLWDAFDETAALPHATTIILGLSVPLVFLGLACVTAFLVLRGSAGAWWLLVTLSALSLLTVAIGQLVTAAAGLAVLVLLLTPSARAWPSVARASRPLPGTS